MHSTEHHTQSKKKAPFKSKKKTEQYNDLRRAKTEPYKKPKNARYFKDVDMD